MEIYEKTFLWMSAVVLVIFFCAILYAAFGLAIRLPLGNAGQIVCQRGQNIASAVLTTPPFSRPGVRQVGPNKYEVVVIGQTWFFYPNKIMVPAGAEVTFKATSVDVIHGFMVPETTINMMLIPGEISQTSFTFKRPGEYNLICHEYCGLEHHTMGARVIVK